jgi:hypothetical protein
MSLFGPPDVAKLKAHGDIKGLIKALGYGKEQDQKDVDLRLAAAQALGEIGTSAVEPLIGALGDERKLVRFGAVFALGQIGDTRAVDSLAAALKDNDEDVRWLAAVDLGKIGDIRATGPLLAALRDTSPRVRSMAAAALQDLAQQFNQAEAARAAAGASLAAAQAPAASPPAVAAPTSPAPASGAEGEMPPVARYRSVDPGKTQRAVELCEEYVDRAHPVDATMQMLGVKRTRPVYRAVQDTVARESQPRIDMMIVSVVTCLPDEDVDINDTAKVARLALEAIQHYASIPKVRAFFLLPYRLRAKTVVEGSAIPPEEQCRVYSGVENLLLEIYEELPGGGTITDEVVERKMDRLIKSVG